MVAALRTENINISGLLKAKEAEASQVRSELATAQTDVAAKIVKLETAKKRQEVSKKQA